MKGISNKKRKFHIPVVTGVSNETLTFSHNGERSKQVSITGGQLEGLLDINLEHDKDLNSVNFFHKHNPGEWLKDGEVNILYHAPFHANIVRKGDLIIMIDQNDDLEIAQYLGGKHYMVKESGSKPLIIKLGLINSYNYRKSIVRYPEKVYLEGMTDFYGKLISSGSLQIHNRLASEKYPLNGTQRLYNTFVDEIQRIYQDQGEQAETSVLSLNERKIIKQLPGNKSLHQNRNSRSFYRDANYSFSIIDNSADIENHEVAMISFLPGDDNSIEIVQIGGNSDFEGENFLEHRTVIIDHMKSYCKELGFNTIKVLKGNKNINFIHPKQKTLKENFDIKRHQDTMLMRYNVTPHRKWGFDKGDERYSYYQL